MAEKQEKMASGCGLPGMEEGRPYELRLGRSFDKDSKVAFHSMRYDFKPASVDTSKMSVLDVEKGNSATVTVPHVEGSGKANTVYKGNRKPCQKECVLIIDHKTGEITIEKLASNIQVKKTRLEGSSKATLSNRPHTPTEKLKSSPTKKPKKGKSTPASASSASSHRNTPPPPPPPQAQQPQQQQPPPPQMQQQQQQQHTGASASQPGTKSHQVTRQPDIGTMSDFSSSDDSGSSSDSDSEPSPPQQQVKAPGTNSSSSSSYAPNKPAAHQRSHGVPSHFMLSDDLQLSDSGSDSD